MRTADHRIRRALIGVGALGVLVSAPPHLAAASTITSRASSATSTSTTTCVRRVVAVGDMTPPNTVLTETAQVAKAQYPHTVILLGDNAYTRGSLTEYQTQLDATPWRDLKPRMRPVPGNHEYGTPGAAGYFAYFAGVAPYYAADLGCGWRGYFLNSELDTAGQAQQLAWLRADLATHPRRPVVVAWHKPLRSSGLHGNNPVMQAAWDAVRGRRAIVLTGHDHEYERFAADTGRRAFVVGTGGGELRPFGIVQPNSRKRIANVSGVLRLNLYGYSRYSWSFRNTANAILDSGSTWSA